jgi:Tfp pilus assembly protein PilO
MNFLPKNKQKRNQLFAALAALILAVAGLAFGLIRPQYLKLANIRKETAETQVKWAANQRLIMQSASSTTNLAELSLVLSSNENDIATGDIYASILDTIRHFKAAYKVEVPEIGQPRVGPMELLPNFPYQQLRLSISGTGYYHDIGKFIADLENKYPHMRVVNLDITPIGSDSEKLSFKADIVALVKSST